MVRMGGWGGWVWVGVLGGVGAWRWGGVGWGGVGVGRGGIRFVPQKIYNRFVPQRTTTRFVPQNINNKILAKEKQINLVVPFLCYVMQLIMENRNNYAKMIFRRVEIQLIQEE